MNESLVPAADPDAPPAPAQRQAALSALFAAVEAAPHDFDFFALMRRVESLRPESPRIGKALRPSQESLRLGQEPDLDFAPAALASFGYEGGAAPRLGVRFFGLLGSHGPMPLHLTEYVRERLRYRNDPTLARFLDIFHHRLLSLFYSAWAQSQPAVQHDRPGDDRFGGWVGATFGLGTEGRSQGHLSETARLFQAGLLGSRSRHPEGLTKILAQFFKVPVRIETYIAHWMVIDATERSHLGHARNRPERNASAPSAPNVLGRSVTAGHKLRDRQFKFRVALGPLTLAQYRNFLPGGTAWLQLCDWVRQYTGLDLLWDVQLCLARAEVPEPRLGRRVPLGVAAWLGRPLVHTHIHTHAQGNAGDRADLRLRPDTSFLLRHGAHHA